MYYQLEYDLMYSYLKDILKYIPVGTNVYYCSYKEIKRENMSCTGTSTKYSWLSFPQPHFKIEAVSLSASPQHIQ